MSEIAFNINGEPFEVPPTMAAWRVRKLKPKGAPEVVWGSDGLPLFLPGDADIEDLRRETGAAGRYRLDPVDDHKRAIASAQASYVCVPAVERVPEPAAPVAPAAAVHTDTTAALVAALLESQKQHTELARMYVSQFPVIANAMAGVVRSAGDVGLTARVPFVVPVAPVAPEVKPAEPSGEDDEEDNDEDDDDDEEEDDNDEQDNDEDVEVSPVPESGWLRFGAKVVDKFGPQIDALIASLAGLAATLAAKRGKRAVGAAGEATELDRAAPAVDPATHLRAIRDAMRPEEGELALRMADELPMAEKIQYVNELLEMSVPEAVIFLRAKLAELRRDRDAAEPGAEVPDAELDAHLSAIRAALNPEDSETVQLIAEELPFELRRNYLRKLAGMSVPEAIAYVRTELSQLGRSSAANRRTVEPRTARSPSAAPSTAASSTPPASDPAPRTAPSAPGMRRREGRRIAGSPLDERRNPAAPRAAITSSEAPTAPVGTLVAVSPAAQAHIAAIQDALTADEDAATRAYVAALSHADRSAWVATLLLLPVPEAVAMIRAQLAADRASAVRPDATSAGADASDPIAPVAGVPPRNLAVPTSAPIASARSADVVLRDEMPAIAPTVPAPQESVAPTVAPVPAAETPPAPLAVATAPAVAAAATLTAAPAATPSAAPPVVEKNAHTHLAAIELALTPEERFLVHAMVAQQSADEREAWLHQLLSRSVADGAAILRDAVSELTTPAPAMEEQPDDGQELDEGEQPDDGQELDDEQPDNGQELDDEQPDDGQELDDEQPDDGQELDEDEQPSRAAIATPQPSAALAAPAGLASAGLPTLDAAALAHFDAIQRALTLAERMRVHEIAGQRPASELRAWIVELAKLPVSEACARLRAALAAADGTTRTTTHGGVS